MVTLINTQVSIIELGAFATPTMKKIAEVVYAHPAYTNPKLPGVAARIRVNSGQRLGADGRKAVERIYSFSLDPKPSLHLPLGKDSIQGIREEVRAIERDAKEHENLSEELDFDM